MTTVAAPSTSHEQRLRAFEERLMALVDEFHQLLEDMDSHQGNGPDHDDTRSS